MGHPGCKKVRPCHLYLSLLTLSGILGHLRTFEKKLGHLRTWEFFFCSSLDLEWKLGHLHGHEELFFCSLPDFERKLGYLRTGGPFFRSPPDFERKLGHLWW